MSVDHRRQVLPKKITRFFFSISVSQELHSKSINNIEVRNI